MHVQDARLGLRGAHGRGGVSPRWWLSMDPSRGYASRATSCILLASRQLFMGRKTLLKLGAGHPSPNRPMRRILHKTARPSFEPQARRRSQRGPPAHLKVCLVWMKVCTDARSCASVTSVDRPPPLAGTPSLSMIMPGISPCVVSHFDDASRMRVYAACVSWAHLSAARFCPPQPPPSLTGTSVDAGPSVTAGPSSSTHGFKSRYPHVSKYVSE